MNRFGKLIKAVACIRYFFPHAPPFLFQILGFALTCLPFNQNTADADAEPNAAADGRSEPDAAEHAEQPRDDETICRSAKATSEYANLFM